MRKKTQKIEKNCGSDVAGCEKIARFNNSMTILPPNRVMRVPMFVSDAKEYLLALDKCRNPRLELVKGEQPYEVEQGIWSAKCNIVYNELRKRGKK